MTFLSQTAVRSPVATVWRVLLASLLLMAGGPGVSQAQEDPVQSLNNSLREHTGGRFSFMFEERTRWEEKTGVNFGKAVDQQDMLSRLRIGARFEATSWLSFSAMGQDTRVPFYGRVAPTSMRDTMDLHEAYVELFGRHKSGFGATFGRQMLNYGEQRLIGTPQWGNGSRTFDSARVYFRASNIRLEALVVSPVKVLADRYNRPGLGERIWGTYNTFAKIWHGASIDVYVLRHSQNRIGGWTGAGTLGTNSFGARMWGTLPRKVAYSLEAVGQTGHLGPLQQRAYAWFANVSRSVQAFQRPLNLVIEYRLATGTKPGATGSGTFDQLAAASHDKFGHQDLFGWRNLKTFRTQETLSLTKKLALNVLYTNHWLYSATDSLYNGSGSSIAISKKGGAGKHVGQELDSFLTCKLGAHLVGAGFGHFFSGEFVNQTTPHVNP